MRRVSSAHFPREISNEKVNDDESKGREKGGRDLTYEISFFPTLPLQYPVNTNSQPTSRPAVWVFLSGQLSVSTAQTDWEAPTVPDTLYTSSPPPFSPQLDRKGQIAIVRMERDREDIFLEIFQTPLSNWGVSVFDIKTITCFTDDKRFILL